MDTASQKKAMNKGFIIIRKDDYPKPRIKHKKEGSDWRTYKNYDTKAERDRAFDRLMQLDDVIND
ncbi:MAG: hypothetical protein PHQ33_05565 [Bacteroidales bacterium]|nr:hypothetical protein [Bacteroidales bacterium]